MNMSITNKIADHSQVDRRESVLTNGSGGSSTVGYASLSASTMTSNSNINSNSNVSNSLITAPSTGPAGGGRRTSIVSANSGRRRASMFDPIDPTEIQKTLYQNQKNSMAITNTNTSNEYLNGDNSIGKIEFGIQYLNDSHKLVVDILRIFDLQQQSSSSGSAVSSSAPKDHHHYHHHHHHNHQLFNTDIYCKLTVLPDKQSFKTSMVKRIADPIFEEQVEFEKIEQSSLEHGSLEIALYECDKSKNECIGITYFRLNNQNIETKKIYLKDLRPSTKSNEENYLGELMFSLAYLPAAERLTIVVMKARNIRTLGVDKKITQPDPFVKVAILSKENGKKLKKKKTSTQKATINPTYNEEIVFNLKKELLDDICINFSLYHDSLTNRELLGTVSISSSTKGDQYIQWKDMIDGKKAIGWWHQIRTSESSSESDGGGGGNSISNYSRQQSQSSNGGGGNGVGGSSGGGISSGVLERKSLKSPSSSKSKSPTINFANLKMKSLSLLSNSPVN